MISCTVDSRSTLDIATAEGHADVAEVVYGKCIVVSRSSSIHLKQHSVDRTLGQLLHNFVRKTFSDVTLKQQFS